MTRKTIVFLTLGVRVPYAKEEVFRSRGSPELQLGCCLVCPTHPLLVEKRLQASRVNIHHTNRLASIGYAMLMKPNKAEIAILGCLTPARVIWLWGWCKVCPT